MSLGERIASHLPYLRRLARAFTGNQVIGDAFVADLLNGLIIEPQRLRTGAPDRLEIFRLLCATLSQEGVVSRPGQDATRWEREVVRRLRSIPLSHRLAFLLRSVEGFSLPEISHILDKPIGEVQHDIGSFADELAGELATDVLIIEDEPIIAMDIEQLVHSLGHRVSGIARTHGEAVAAVTKSRPGLILADIQLADGSSGIEAVNEILAEFDLPVIFITAYPERLLTGARPEPTFLIAKPFQPDMVRAIISQALFFNEEAHLPDYRSLSSTQPPANV
jgi:CheY-like chemotaxis protein/DNA-directed RNA polymerase specialized sigma24 family protein